MNDRQAERARETGRLDKLSDAWGDDSDETRDELADIEQERRGPDELDAPSPGDG